MRALTLTCQPLLRVAQLATSWHAVELPRHGLSNRGFSRLFPNAVGAAQVLSAHLHSHFRLSDLVRSATPGCKRVGDSGGGGRNENGNGKKRSVIGDAPTMRHHDDDDDDAADEGRRSPNRRLTRLALTTWSGTQTSRPAVPVRGSAWDCASVFAAKRFAAAFPRLHTLRLRHHVWLWPVRVLQTILDRVPTLRILTIDGAGATPLSGAWIRAKPIEASGAATDDDEVGRASSNESDIDSDRDRYEGADSGRTLVLPATLHEYRDNAGSAIDVEFPTGDAPCDLRALELALVTLPGTHGTEDDEAYRTAWMTRLSRLHTLRYRAIPDDVVGDDEYMDADNDKLERRRCAWYRALAALPALTDLAIECAPSGLLRWPKSLDSHDPTGRDVGSASASSPASASARRSSAAVCEPSRANLRRLALNLKKYERDARALAPERFTFLGAYAGLRDLRITTATYFGENGSYRPPSEQERAATERILAILAGDDHDSGGGGGGGRGCVGSLEYLQLPYVCGVEFAPPTLYAPAAATIAAAVASTTLPDTSGNEDDGTGDTVDPAGDAERKQTDRAGPTDERRFAPSSSSSLSPSPPAPATYAFALVFRAALVVAAHASPDDSALHLWLETDELQPPLRVAILPCSLPKTARAAASLARLLAGGCIVSFGSLVTETHDASWATTPLGDSTLSSSTSVSPPPSPMCIVTRDTCRAHQAARQLGYCYCMTTPHFWCSELRLDADPDTETAAGSMWFVTPAGGTALVSSPLGLESRSIVGVAVPDIAWQLRPYPDDDDDVADR